MCFKVIPVQTVYLERHKYDHPVLRDLSRPDLMDVVMPNPALVLLPRAVLCVSRQLISRALLAATHCPDAFVQQDKLFLSCFYIKHKILGLQKEQPGPGENGRWRNYCGGIAQHHQRLVRALCLSSEPTFTTASQDFAGNSCLCFLQACQKLPIRFRWCKSS